MLNERKKILAAAGCSLFVVILVWLVWFTNESRTTTTVSPDNTTTRPNKITSITFPEAFSGYLQHFEDFKIQYKKEYKSPEEEATAFTAFVKNSEIIDKRNSEKRGFTLKMNRFGDLSRSEFAAKYLGLSGGRGNPKFLKQHEVPKGAVIPDSIDWSELGGVTPVKDQGQCGSCWAFSTTGALEGALFAKTKKLVSLSEQEFVDCATGQSAGCNGGIMEDAFVFAETNRICTEKTYPYKMIDDVCHLDQVCKVGIERGEVVGFVDIKHDDENALLHAISKQPVSIAVDGGDEDFVFYSSGILTAPCGNDLDHGVLVVGYGVEDGERFYKVKNSWGTSWGENGYIRLGRGDKSKPDGECGILGQPTYPELRRSAAVHVEA